MGETTVFFNPRCSKCRTAWSMLEELGVEASQYRYLEERPAREDIERVMRLLGVDDPRAMMRTGEDVYRQNRLAEADRDQLIDAMVEHPILIERPIVIVDDRAVIARPPEKLRELFV